MISLIAIVLLFLVVLASYFIAFKTYGRLVKGGNAYPKTISVITFIVSFAIILFVVAILFLMNVPFER